MGCSQAAILGSMPDARSRLDAAAVVKTHLARIQRGEILAAIADYANDCVLESRGVGTTEGGLLNGTFQGREAVGRWIDTWFSSFERGSYRFEVEESIEKGDRLYLALRHTARGAASGADVTNDIYHVFTVRDGLIVRHTVSGVREDVLRATDFYSG
jgi:ketosteroid isomerase-like protein